MKYTGKFGQTLHNLKTSALVILSLLAVISSRAQSSVRIGPDTLYISFDTTGADHGYAINDEHLYHYNYRFDFHVMNNGKTPVRLAGNSPYKLTPETLAPGASGLLRLDDEQRRMPSSEFLMFRNVSVKSRQVNLAFFAGDTPMIKTITFNYTYGPSSLVRIDRNFHRMDSIVEQQVKKDSGRYSSHNYVQAIQVENISKLTFELPVHGQAYNDWGNKLEYSYERDLQLLTPGKKAPVMIDLSMANKKIFDVYGSLVFYDQVHKKIDIIFTRFKSDYHD